MTTDHKCSSKDAHEDRVKVLSLKVDRVDLFEESETELQQNLVSSVKTVNKNPADKTFILVGQTGLLQECVCVHACVRARDESSEVFILLSGHLNAASLESPNISLSLPLRSAANQSCSC